MLGGSDRLVAHPAGGNVRSATMDRALCLISFAFLRVKRGAGETGVGGSSRDAYPRMVAVCTARKESTSFWRSGVSTPPGSVAAISVV